tara:strand:- start:153 stop:323 length:171 start_codon:yes stop_codon:yes gene_type:complete
MYLPASLILLVVAMWGGFSPAVATPVKWLVLATTLLAIAGATFLLARTIKRVLLRN